MEVITDMVLNGQIDRETISKSYLQGSGTNASLVELLKLKLQTVKHFLQAGVQTFDNFCSILVDGDLLLHILIFYYHFILSCRLRCHAASFTCLT